ncbi:MAG: DUF2155 domain-containing protein [Phenylobacterium sp.]|uniref:DUF2155 domain-containing protein n=1 Tax=Phenylobacterium sp. TaxID=1871053 RepID=UPI002A3624C4|nr:DUF2155 domain-containing protein [Phenylobacterium sp.]MDX9998500.1 DUF2155 domain-containing protein [Phenylobacterium sp.]
MTRSRMDRRKGSRLLLGAATLTGAGALALVVSAQPAPQLPPPAVQPAPGELVIPPVDAAPPQEEAPPAVVEALPPEPAPPLPVEKAEPDPEPEPETKTAEEKAAPEPLPKRIRHNVAVLQAIDKITAETLRFEAKVGQPVRYKNLVFTVRACERATADEAMEDAIAYVEIDSQPRAAPGRSTPPARRAFRGWMYASSPGLNPLEHPVYDAWVITCRAPVPEQVAAAPRSASTSSAATSRR